MKTIVNRRFLIILLVGLMLGGAAIHGLHAIQADRESNFLLAQARHTRDEKQFELAMDYYQQYVALVPQDFEAQAEFALLQADLAVGGGDPDDMESAAIALENVLRSRPDRADLRRRVVELDVKIGRFGDAQVHLRQYLLAKSPDDASLLELLGSCQAGAGEYSAAVDSFRAAIKVVPQRIETYRRLAEVLQRKLDRANEARECLEEMVRINPNSARAHVFRGEYLETIGQQSQGLEEAETAVRLAPLDADALRLAARLNLAKGQYERARSFAQRAIDSAPTSVVGYLALADVEYRGGSKKRAIALLDAGVEKTAPNNGPLLCELGRLQIESGDLAAAQGTVDRLHKLSADDHQKPLIDYLEAQLEFTRQHWQRALEQFRQLAPLLVNSPDLVKNIHYQIAACHEKLGNPKLQLAAYREAAQIDPLWPPARVGIATTLASLGKLDEALEEYRQMSRLDGLSAAGLDGEVGLLILRNLANGAAEQDWQEVNAILDRLTHDNPASIGVTLLRAEALVGQNRVSDAEKFLVAALEKSPDQVRLWTALVALATRERQWERAAHLFDEANQKFGDQVWLRLAKGSSLLVQYRQESAPKLKVLGEGTGALTRENLLVLFRGLATLSLEAGDTEQAKEFARRACSTDPKNLEVYDLLLELAFRSTDITSVEEVLKEIRDLEGEGPLWHFGQAELCLLSKPPNPVLEEAAFQHLSAVAKLRPGWARVPLLTARIQDHRGRGELALQNYLDAIDLGERDPDAVRRAIELLYSRQRFTEADRILRRLKQQPALFPNKLERLDSEISARLDDLDRALGIATRLAVDSRDWRDHLWMGQLQSLVGLRAQAGQQFDVAKNRYADAEKSLRLAVQLGPDVPETWVALIRFFAAIDRKPEAETTIRQAQRRLPAATAAVALGACYEVLGNLEEAAKLYDSALANTEHDPIAIRRLAEFCIRSGRLADAEARLRTIISGQVAAQPDDVAWARRALASLLRTSGNYTKIQQALALVAQNLAKGSTTEDLLEKALELAACPQRERHQEAIQILERNLPSQPGMIDGTMKLIQLYLAEKDWPKASRQLRNLVTIHGQDPRCIAFYAARLLDRHETGEAELWIDRLERLAPHMFLTASLRAESLIQRQRPDSAIKTLCEYLAQPNLQAASRVAQTQQIAARFEELSHRVTYPDQAASASKLLAEAERLYRQCASEQPDQKVVLASYLGRRGRFEDALGIAEDAVLTSSADATAGMCSELLASGLVEPTQRSRLERLLLSAAEKYQRPPSVLLALGDLRMSQQRFEDAIQIYHEVLTKDNVNPVAMNNLAALLALERKDLNESLRLVDRAIEVAGPFPMLLDSRASVYLAMNKPQLALADLEEAVRDEPGASYQFHRALALWQLGKEQAAAQALGEARKLGLKLEDLNPLERPEYEHLTAKLEHY